MNLHQYCACLLPAYADMQRVETRVERDQIILSHALLYYTILYYTILYYTILLYTTLYYSILLYTTLYYTILYYTILLYVLFTLLFNTPIMQDPAFLRIESLGGGCNSSGRVLSMNVPSVKGLWGILYTLRISISY